MVSETLIVGGGLAGGAAATRLARAGVPVQLFEREAGPHDKVCGEFVSIEARRDLAALGLDPARLGAVPIDRVRLVARGREIEARLPFTALGLSRRVLDAALLDAAAAAGARIERGVRVNAIGDRTVRTRDGAIDAERVLVATGKHALRGTGAGDTARTDYVGFKLHWRVPARAAARLSGAIELLVFGGGYAGLQLVGERLANLCLIVRRQTLAAAGGGWDALLAALLRDPAFAARLADAEPAFARPLSIAALPYGRVLGARDAADGVFRLGDQAAMTASLTGDGMAGALLSARLAAATIVAGGSAGAYQARLRGAVHRQVSRAMLLQRLTERPVAMGFAMAALRFAPALLGRLAAATRLPSDHDEGAFECV